MNGAAAETAIADPVAQRARLLERCREAVRLARAAGADEAEACAGAARTVSVTLERGEVKLARVGERESVGLRVFVGRRLGFASTNQLEGDALAELGRDAVLLARLSPPDEHNGLPETAPVEGRAALVDDALWSWPVERVVEGGLDLRERLRALDSRVSVDSASFELTASSSAVASSAGAAAAESDAGVGCSMFGMAVDGDDVGGFDARGDWTRDSGAIDALVGRAVARFGETTLGNLGAGAGESYRGPVLFAPEALLSLLVAPLAGAASAIAVQRGRSALAGKLGERIADPRFHLVDAPDDGELAGCGAFDREGVATRRLALVEDGVFRAQLYNGYAAHVDGRASTGHASGGSKSVPGVSVHGLCVAPGEGGDVARLRATLGRGLLVQRFSGTVDPTSGDFSGVAKSARWVEDGAVVRPVGETLLAGNAFEALRAIVALGSEAERLSGAHRVPWGLLDGISVTAG